MAVRPRLVQCAVLLTVRRLMAVFLRGHAIVTGFAGVQSMSDEAGFDKGGGFTAFFGERKSVNKREARGRFEPRFRTLRREARCRASCKRFTMRNPLEMGRPTQTLYVTDFVLIRALVHNHVINLAMAVRTLGFDYFFTDELESLE